MSSPSGILWEILHEAEILVTYYDGEGQVDRWDAYFKVLGEFLKRANPRFLVYTLVPPPRSTVDSLLRVTRGGRWRTALVSPSLAVRFVASTFSMAVRDLRYFHTDALDDALAHLVCPPEERREVYAALARLRESARTSTTPGRMSQG